VSSGATRRQEIVQRLGEGEWSFEGLRHALQVSVRTLEDDLRHVERSVRRSPRKLRVEPARCADCDFVFCPRCRSEQILEARLRLEG
jgi:predicted Zn-ribbon and HTH transcriptional regulator